MLAREKRAGGEPKGRLSFAIVGSVRDGARRGTGHPRVIDEGVAATAFNGPYPAISRALKK